MRSGLIALALIFLVSCHTTDSWRRGRHRRPYIKHSQNHRSHYSQRHTSSKFLMPSGQSSSVKNPHASKSFPCKPGAKVIEIKYNDKEYKMVVNEFTKSNKNPRKKFLIKKVEKVYNGCWLQKYNYRQKQIKRELGAGPINEKMIFHGTTNAHIVAQKGFDERFAQKKLDFGAGIYFSDHISTANDRTKANRRGLREVLLCRVTLGKKYMAASVQKYAHSPVGSHSVVSGNRYVIYRGEQAYPDFIITYRVK